MLRKLILLTLSALLMLTGLPFARAEDDFSDDLIIENIPPEEPIVTEGEFIRVTAQYLPDGDFTRYTAELINNPTFADGTALTAKDLLFSLYVYADPGYPLFWYPTAASSIAGLESYQKQVSAERLTAADETLTAIREVGANHVWTASDGWTEELQTAYWNLHAEYIAACEAEFANCAQAIVDYCAGMLPSDASDRGSADDGQLVAFAMQQWGYAASDGSTLTARRSGKVWNLDESAPTLADFVSELSLTYDGDLAACWEIESTGTYAPALPNLKHQFTELFLGDEKDSILSVSGIRMTGDMSIEIDLVGVNMREAGALFGQPVFSLARYGDAAQWSPEDGLYGHPFGDLSVIGDTAAIEAAVQDGPVLLEHSDEISF